MSSGISEGVTVTWSAIHPLYMTPYELKEAGGSVFVPEAYEAQVESFSEFATRWNQSQPMPSKPLKQPTGDVWERAALWDMLDDVDAFMKSRRHGESFHDYRERTRPGPTVDEFMASWNATHTETPRLPERLRFDPHLLSPILQAAFIVMIIQGIRWTLRGFRRPELMA